MTYFALKSAYFYLLIMPVIKNGLKATIENSR